MNQVYKILDEVKDHFEANGITNKVIYGTRADLDADKTTMMPIALLNLTECVFNANIVTFTLEVLCVGFVNEYKAVDPVNDFFGSDNLQDVLNEQFVVMAKFIKSLEFGSLFTDNLIQLDGEVRAEMVMDFLENGLAGWYAPVSIKMQNDISGC